MVQMEKGRKEEEQKVNVFGNSGRSITLGVTEESAEAGKGRRERPRKGREDAEKHQGSRLRAQS